MLALLMLLAVAAPQSNAAPPAQSQPQTQTANKPLPPGVVQVQLDSLHCPSCAKQIARNLYKTPGVMRVRTDMKKDQVWITAQPKKQLDLAQVWQATKIKDAAPVTLRIGDRVFAAKDFEKAAETAARSTPAAQR
ncbi:hypothetical protein Pla123a_36000 [Posidoniimonas polymericola]|uniref:HMA domain-containing protein n=1 Tax=Posidoniimonas polymericola TaxID=2528002 RepID=A0A5C5YDA6_9BACT|nr:heavy-metal-associated domain-containing protein [Posidoniimonas polymericola]TWT73707.1 hypothetical protein Pla123a_36000 [Posidoniimonas polymericola]